VGEAVGALDDDAAHPVGGDAVQHRREAGPLMYRVDKGDGLMVTRVDRLARSTRDLLNILDAIAKAGAGFKSLGDRRTPPRRTAS
jgi:DNA invertase Pin-like site-specific DNA recombinase